MSEKDISWKSDRETRFKQPPGFTFAECSADTSCSDCLGGSKYSSCGNYTDPSTGTEYKFWYPDDATVSRRLFRCRTSLDRVCVVDTIARPSRTHTYTFHWSAG